MCQREPGGLLQQNRGRLRRNVTALPETLQFGAISSTAREEPITVEGKGPSRVQTRTGPSNGIHKG